MIRKSITILTLATTSIGAILSLGVRRLMPQVPESVPTVLAFSGAASIILVGSALLFTLSLKKFTAKLKVAYSIFCIGIVLFALSQLQIPIEVMFISNQEWLHNGLVLLPTVGSLICIYAGVRLLAKLFGVQSRWLSPWLVVASAILAGVIGATLLPVGPNSTLAEAKGELAVISVCLMLFLASAILTYRIKQSVATRYARAMHWFFLANAGLVVQAIQTILVVVILGSNHWILNYGYTLLVETFLVLPYLKAAYEFNALESATATTTPAQSTTNVLLLDVVMSAAARVSNPRTIESLLDNVRQVTAGYQTRPEALSPKETATLTHVYRGIEQYLAGQEPVRRYQPEELRDAVAHELRIPVKRMTELGL